MNRILIPTDFSPHARHSLKVVLEMIKDTQQSTLIFLLNTFIVQQTDPEKVIQLNDQLKKNSLAGLQKELLFAKEHVRNPHIMFETISHLGSLNHVIQQLLHKEKIELVAMGKDGGRQVESVNVILKKNHCPLLVTYLSS